MATRPADIVLKRNSFYQKSYFRLLFVFVFTLFINIALISLLIWMVKNPPRPKYFATLINGRIARLYPLNQANQSDVSVLGWATQAGIASYSYNWVNYRQELQAASEFFTPSGWQKFLAALETSNNLDAVKARKWVVSATVLGKPKILSKQLIRDPYPSRQYRYSWWVELRVFATFQSTSEFTQQENIVRLLIKRVSTLNSPSGIGIEQFVVKQQKLSA